MQLLHDNKNNRRHSQIMIRVSHALFLMSILALFGCGNNKPVAQSNANKPSDTQATSQTPAQSSESQTPIVNSDPIHPEDRQNIETVVRQAAADLIVAINQRDFNRMDKYFDTEDATVKNRLAAEKKNLRADAANTQLQIHDVKLDNLKMNSLKINGDRAEVLAIATVTGTIVSEGQKAPITQNHAQKISLRKTEKGWLITQANWQES